MKNSCSVGCGFTVLNFHLPTLPETNIAPEHWWLEDGFPCGICHFQGRAVGFRDCKLVEDEPKLIHFGESLRSGSKEGCFWGVLFRSRDVKFENILAICVVHQCKRGSLSNVFMRIECFFHGCKHNISGRTVCAYAMWKIDKYIRYINMYQHPFEKTQVSRQSE